MFSSLPNLTEAISMEISPGESEEMTLLKSRNAELEMKIDCLNEMYLEALGKVSYKTKQVSLLSFAQFQSDCSAISLSGMKIPS